jgi:hypothetical protein
VKGVRLLKVFFFVDSDWCYFADECGARRVVE